MVQAGALRPAPLPAQTKQDKLSQTQDDGMRMFACQHLQHF